MTNIKDKEKHIINCVDKTEARHWVVDHLDLSKGWEIKKDNLFIKNNIDVSYRNIQNVDNQWQAMSYILDCLTDNQLKTAQKLINKVLKQEKEEEKN
jgi:hypothetical protein